MMIKKHLLLLLLALFFISKSKAQTYNYAESADNLPQPVAPKNYNGNGYSIDLFTGIANVNVPIYDYSIDGFDLGISLSYATKGINVDEVASEVGLGWNLSAGGYMTRTVYGLPDELHVPANTTDTNELCGYFETCSMTAPCYKEDELDKYDMIFNGKDLRSTFYGAVGPDFQITASLGTVTENGHTFNTYIYTDKHGNIFEFGRVDYYTQIYNGNEYYIPYKYWLTDVKTIYGHEITLQYNQNEVSYADYMDQRVSEVKDPNWEITGDVVDSGHIWSGTISHISEIDYPNGVTANFSYGSVARCDLYNDYSLDSITISNQYSSSVQNSITYRFNYAYFNSNTSGSAEVPITTTCTGLNQNELRLKLKSIDMAGQDHGASEPYYTFDYNATRLPARLSPAKDWFGFYNGNTVTSLLYAGVYHYLSIPYHTILVGSTSTPYGVDKSPNISYLQACILNDVKNSKGGETTYSYQAPSSLSNPPSSSERYTMPTDFDATNTYDGLCIDSIVYKDGYNGQNTKKTFFTFKNGNRFYTGGYYWIPLAYGTDPASGGTPTYRYYRDHFTEPYDLFRNSNHGYSNVEVKTQGTELLSDTKYYYTNIVGSDGKTLLDDDKSSLTLMGMPRTRFSKSELGVLMKKENYDANNHLLSKDTFQYQAKIFNPSAVGSSNRYFQYSYWDYSGGGAPVLVTTPINRTYDCWDANTELLSAKTSTEYSGGTSISRTTQYDYDDSGNIVDMKWQNSKGQTLEKQYLYNYTYYFTDHGPHYFLPNGFYQYYIGQKLFIVPAPGDVDTIINTHLDIPSLNTANHIVFRKSFNSAYAHPNSYAFNEDDYNAVFKNVTTATFLRTDTNRIYDDHEHVLETQHYDRNYYTSAIWDNRIGERIAEARNAYYDEIAYTSFEGTFAALGTADYNKGNWDFDPSYIHIPSSTPSKAFTGHYTFQLMDQSIGNTVVSKYGLKNGKKYILSYWSDGLSYVYQGSPTSGTAVTMQKQTIAPINGWNLYTATITGNGSGLTIIGPYGAGLITDIDELRLCPADAEMMTYTYEPLFGISSVCDERNNILYYEYDRMGRLKDKRDVYGNIIELTRHINQGADN